MTICSPSIAPTQLGIAFFYQTAVQCLSTFQQKAVIVVVVDTQTVVVLYFAAENEVENIWVKLRNSHREAALYRQKNSLKSGAEHHMEFLQPIMSKRPRQGNTEKDREQKIQFEP